MPSSMPFPSRDEMQIAECAADTMASFVSPRGWWKVARRLDYYRRLAAVPGPRPGRAGRRETDPTDRPTNWLTCSPGPPGRRTVDGWSSVGRNQPD